MRPTPTSTRKLQYFTVPNPMKMNIIHCNQRKIYPITLGADVNVRTVPNGHKPGGELIQFLDSVERRQDGR